MKILIYAWSDPIWLLTNWKPVSLRIPMPAEAKFAPLSSLRPLSSGLRYGNGDSSLPIASPNQY